MEVIVNLAALGKSRREIAETTGLSDVAVGEHLAQLSDTRTLAKRIAYSGASTLAQRIIEDATPDQAIKVLESLDVLPRPQAQSMPVVNISIGMPGHPIGPVPFATQSVPVVDALSEVIDAAPALSAAPLPAIESVEGPLG